MVIYKIFIIYKDDIDRSTVPLNQKLDGLHCLNLLVSGVISNKLS